MIDPKKKYTSDKQPVRILCTDLKGFYPIAAVVLQKDGTEYLTKFTSDGKWYTDHATVNDLKEVPIFDWSKLSVNDLVMDYLHNKYHLHSYNPKTNICLVFADGKSSGTANGATQTFKAETLIPIG